MNPRFLPQMLGLFMALVISSAAVAHPGHYHPPEEVDEFEQETFFSAAAHPFTGLDHLLAMLVVGALAAAAGSGLGAVFVAAVAMGFVTGLAGPEWLVALTLAALGGALWKGMAAAPGWLAAAAGLAGFLHGGAHAQEMHGVAAGLGLGVGTLAGVVLAMVAVRRVAALPAKAVRYAGASVAVIGVLLAVARLAQA